MKSRRKLYIILISSLLFCLTAAAEPGYCGYSIAPDKKLHLGAGIIIGTGSYFICPELEELIFDKTYIHPVLWSIGMASLAGAGKEIVYDHMMGRGYADIYDFYYTAAGGVISGLTLYIIESIFNCRGNNISIEADPVEKNLTLAYRRSY